MIIVFMIDVGRLIFILVRDHLGLLGETNRGVSIILAISLLYDNIISTVGMSLRDCGLLVCHERALELFI